MAFLLLFLFYQSCHCQCTGDPMGAGVTVAFESSSLVVVEANNFSVCISAISEKWECPYEFTIEPTLEFISADRGDVWPVDRIPTVVLTNNISTGCINFQALQNNDSYRFSETFALTIMNSSSYLVNQSRIVITIIENTLVNAISVPSRVNVSEGNTAVICIAAEFILSSKIVLGLATQDYSTSSDDYSRDAIPDNVILSRTQSIKCLRIPVFVNDDGHNSTESFQITFSYKLAAPGVEQLNLSSVLVTLHEQCLDGEIRLVNGTIQGEGLIEICRDGVFGTMCPSNWTVDDSNMICRQLGHISTGDAAHHLVDSIDCMSNEKSLSNCSSGNIEMMKYCNGYAVVVHCQPGCQAKFCPEFCRLDEFECPSEEKCLWLSYICDGTPDCITTTYDVLDEEECFTPGCLEGKVLPLVGGASDKQGFVQVCVGGNYHPVIMASFTIAAATVVCRSMGLGTAGFPLSATEDLRLDLNHFFKMEVEFLARVKCSGVETSLSQCVIETTLFHSITDLAGIQCTEVVQCSDNDFRLMSASGISSTEGRVEVCFLGVWGAIFDPDWTALEASIMCKELQQNPKGALPFISATYPNDAQFIPVVYDSPACDSDSYGSVLECPRAAKLCAHNNESGNLPLFYGNGAGSVSGDLSAPSEELMGLLGRLTDEGRRAGIGYVGVKCETYPHSGCNESDVRLTYRDRSQASGNLEICSNNTWAIVCFELFDENILNVTCRALGFTYFEGSMKKHRFFEVNTNASSPKFQQRLVCRGFESSLGECSSDNVTESTCTNVRIQCLARPRIYVSPQPRDGTFSVEQNRRAKLECLVDQESYPPITSLRNPVSSVADKRSLLNIVPLCSSVSLYETEAAQVNDSGNYSCGDNRGASVGVEIKVKTPDPMDIRIVHYLRLTTVSSQRLLPCYGVANSTDFIERIVLHSIPSDFVGLQTVKCYEVTRDLFEEGRHLIRVECLVVNFLPPSVYERSSLWSAVSSALLKRLYPTIILFVKTSESGFCDFDRMEYEGSTYMWPELSTGATTYQPCPNNRTVSKLMRQCLADGVWTQPNASACVATNDMNEEMTEDKIEEQTNLVENAVESAAKDSSMQTADLFGSVASFFSGLAMNISNGTVSPMVMESLVRGFGFLQQWEGSVISDNPEISNSIVKSFEAISTQFADQLPVSTNFSQIVPNQVAFIAENALIKLLKQSGRLYSVSGNQSGVSFGGIDNSSHPGQVASLRLPIEIFQGIAENTSRTDIGLVFSFYYDNTVFPLRQAAVSDAKTTRRLTVASSVLASTVGLDIKFKDLDPPVEFTMALSIGKVIVAAGSEKCAFWEFEAAGGKGNWSFDGCTVISRVNGLVTCRCTHLTNFAILVDICSRLEDCEEPSPDLSRALSYISYIGIAISMPCLLITIFTMIGFKTLRKQVVSKYHAQLSIAIFMMLLVFVAGIEQAINEYILCLVVSMLLHYFTLASVMWMGAEAVLMFHKLIFVFKHITTKYIVVVSCICWLSPLPLVLIPLTVDLAGGNDPSNDLIISRGNYCFLSNIVVFWVSFLGPLLIVVLSNIVLFVVVIVVLVKHLRNTKHRYRKSRMQNKTTFRLMLSIIGIMFLFGLSWIFAAFTITIQAIQLPAQVLFTIFSSTQGFAIFIFFCVISQEVRELWKVVLSCGRYKSKFLNRSKISKTSSASTFRLRGTGTVTKGTFTNRTPDTMKYKNRMQSMATKTITTNSTSSLDHTQQEDLKGSNESYKNSSLITESDGCIILTNEQSVMESTPTTPKIDFKECPSSADSQPSTLYYEECKVIFD